MFNTMSSWLEGAKAAVSNSVTGVHPETDSESEGTEGPDSEKGSVTPASETPDKTATEKTEVEAPAKTPSPTGDNTKAESPKAEAASTEQTVPASQENDNAENGDGNSTAANIQRDMQEVSAKAIDTAKNWGSYLLGFGKTATTQVAETAKKLKTTVEEKTILGDFQKEQEKFVTESKEKKSKAEAAVPPWVGYNEEEAMKTQILALSQDKRNFLRNPPAGVQFNFDFHSAFPVAMAVLADDPNLEKMRFELVPKQLKEDVFWRNYFYRVSLIKQSAQLTSLAQQTGTSDTGSTKSHDSSRRSSLDGNSSGDNKETESKDPMEMVNKSKKSSSKEEDIPSGTSPPDNEFISDAFQHNDINEDDLRKEMQQLGMNEGKTGGAEQAADDIPEWEKELQAELQEYEVVDDGTGMDDADLEKEILQQIEAEANQS